MNAHEQIKYNKLKEENTKLKEKIDELENQISYLDKLIVDLYVVAIAERTQLSLIWSYFKEMYPKFINIYEARTTQRLAQLWNYLNPGRR